MQVLLKYLFFFFSIFENGLLEIIFSNEGYMVLPYLVSNETEKMVLIMNLCVTVRPTSLELLSLPDLSTVA